MSSNPPEQPNPGGQAPGASGPEPKGWGDASLRSQHLDGDALSAYLDQRLDPEETAAARAHLTTCPECGRELAELRATVALLRELPQYLPRRTFQLGPEHARGTARGGAGVGGWFERLVPAFPALRIATVAVAMLLIAVIAGDLVVNRGAEPAPLLQSVDETDEAERAAAPAPESAPALAPRARAPAAGGTQPRSAAYQATEAGFEDAEAVAQPAAETGTEPGVPASMDADDSVGDAPGVVAPEPAARPEPAPTPPSGWRLAQVGLGLALLWLIVSLAGVAWLRRDQS